MRVLVCGGRDFKDREYFTDAMDMLRVVFDITSVIHGGARGADHEAQVWAESRGIPVHSFPADWDMHGRAAGPIRNKQMLDVGKPDMVVAFSGGKGTANMIKQASAAGVRVIDLR